MTDLLENIVYPVHENLLKLDLDLCVVDASPAYYKTFSVTPAETLDRKLGELGNGQWNIPKLLESLRELPPTDGDLDAFEVNHDFPTLGRRKMILSARRSSSEADGTGTITLAIDEVTGDPKTDAELLLPREPLVSEVDAPNF
jgi:hypothetical protein